MGLFTKLFGKKGKKISENNQTFVKDYTQFYENENINNDKFKQNLFKTINWTNQIIESVKERDGIDNQMILRTINPIYEGTPFYTFEKTHHDYATTPDIPFNYAIVLNEIFKLRTNAEINTNKFSAIGRILKFEIDITTQDGGPCTATNGFIDELDIPPIDTWFYITKKNLYCWIPNIFIETIQHAMEVEILDSYTWIFLDDENL